MEENKTPNICRRAKANHEFTIIYNDLINDDTLSAGALGILVWALQKPDTWVFHKNHIQKRFRIGRKLVDGYFNELIDAGYLISTDTVRASGKFNGKIYIFYDKSIFTDVPTEHRLNSTDVLLPPTVKVHLVSTNSIVRTNSIIARKKNFDDRFDIFWDLYGKKVGKQKTMKLWGKLKHEEIDHILQVTPVYVRIHHEEQFRKDPERFLSHRAWEDEKYQPKTPLTTLKSTTNNGFYQLKNDGENNHL